jgi:MOSC domain-containing protein YiiM
VRVVSVNVGKVREITWRGRTLRTGIFKEPVEGAAAVDRLGIAGDRQVDRSVHGGEDKAVYAYPLEHYRFWSGQLPRHDLAPGAFGENLTTEGLLEEDVEIGDRFRIGSAELQATWPRLPCHKLAARFDDPGMIRRFLRSLRSGFYLAVLAGGRVRAGDPIERIGRGPGGLTVTDVVRLHLPGPPDVGALRRAAGHEALSEERRERFRRQLREIA